MLELFAPGVYFFFCFPLFRFLAFLSSLFLVAHPMPIFFVSFIKAVTFGFYFNVFILYQKRA